MRFYLAESAASPAEVLPAPSRRKYLTRNGISGWLFGRLAEDIPTLAGIDHRFSFPLRYFELHCLEPDWPKFLDDFQDHCPTNKDCTYVDFVRDGLVGNGEAGMGNTRWRRLTEERVRTKLVSHFDVQGQVAKSTHAGITWVRFIRQRLGASVHFWPFDGWDIPAGRSAIAEVYPSLWSSGLSRQGGSDDQHDAFSVAAWLSRANRNGTLAAFLKPNLSCLERKIAKVEGWILVVGGSPYK